MTLGYILGVAVGVGLAIVVSLIWRGEQIVRPLMLGVFAIPKVALAPLVIVWFGIYLLPKVILAASLVLFIVYFSTLAGFAAVNRDLVASVVQPVRKLRGFQRVSLKPGEVRRVSFTLTTGDLAFYNTRMQLVTEPGKFQVWIAPDAMRGAVGELELR